MVLLVITLSPVCVFAVNPATWEFTNLQTTGQDVEYHPATPVVDSVYLEYDYVLRIDKVEFRTRLVIADVWVDAVSGGLLEPIQIDGQVTDGLPEFLIDESFTEQGLQATVRAWVDADGRGHVSITEVQLGTIEGLTISGLRASGSFTLTGTRRPLLTTGVISGEGSLAPSTSARDFGRLVDLTATPAPLWELTEWIGADQVGLTGLQNTALMDRDRTVQVRFARIAPAAFDYLSPADGATDTADSITLDWADSVGADAYRVYLDTANPPLARVAETSQSAHTTAPLAAGQTYYWRVEAVNPRTVLSGPVYQFKTARRNSARDAWTLY